jgi:sugar fermentation stimulation protein A
MKRESPLIEGIFLKRYKRFFADFELAGKVEIAHVPNTGSLKSCNQAQSPCLVSPAKDPNRKLRWTLEAIQSRETGAWVGVNTSWPNHLVREAHSAQLYSHWKNFDACQWEAKLNAQTRIDFCLSNSQTNKKHYVEVKNVTMAEKGLAQFPDAVTERGQKHLKEMLDLMAKGHTAEIFFTVQRNDCRQFSPADHIDPEYGKLLRIARDKGMIISPYVVEVSPHEIKLTAKKLPVVL